jgi:hypothetical protein
MGIGIFGLSVALMGGCGGEQEQKKLEDTAAEEEDSGTVVDTFCSDQGLDAAAFDASGTSGDLGETAPDFTLNTINHGSWTLSENWTGCDSYMFINYYQPSGYPVSLTSPGNLSEFLEASPLNVHYFILLYPHVEGAEAIEAELTDIWSRFVGAYDRLDPELADHWRKRVHFVSDSGWEADWLGPLNSQYYVDGGYVQWSVSIDRFQRVRENGNFCDPSTGWESCPPIFLQYEPVYFNFEAEREASLAEAVDVTAITVFDQEATEDPGWSGLKTYGQLELPDAATMAGFDTMEFDLELECRGFPAGTECPAWDYIVTLYLCDEDDPSTEEDESESCPQELGRWITTYWRPGRWVSDVTPFLALLQEGGTRKVAFYSQQYYNVSLDVRLSNQGVGHRPVAMEKIFTGGALDRHYNWGLNHSISAAEWSWQTVPESVETFEVAQWGEWNDQTRFDIGSDQWTVTSITETGEEQVAVYEVAESDESQGYAILAAPSEDTAAPSIYARYDFAWDGNGALYICKTAEGVDLGDAQTAEEHCMPGEAGDTGGAGVTECHPRADAEDWLTGCNFGRWSPLSRTGGTDDGGIAGEWTDGRQARFALAENGSDNPEEPGKWSRLDYTWSGGILHFCHNVEDSGSMEDAEQRNESCETDNPDTSTADESQSCPLYADPRDLDRGCNGSAWRAMSEASGAGSGVPEGEWTELWHEDKLPISFTPPEGTSHIEVAGYITGHGFGTDTKNCAEFCDHQHRFTVNGGTSHTKTHDYVGNTMGCADQVSMGTVPNQSGTWVYGRAGWCPGMEVEVWRADVSSDVDVGSENQIEYLGLVDGDIYHPNWTSSGYGPNINMQTYLVYHQ